MCGRFVRARAAETYGDFFGVPNVPKLFASFNIAPTQQVLALRIQDNAKAWAALRWGLIPSWAQDKKRPLINARAETVGERPTFRDAFKKRRCLIVADGYYEWQATGKKAKQPYYFCLNDDRPFAFAGLWETWAKDGESMESCAIVTTKANDLGRPIHDRMPVILRDNEADAWIDPVVEEPKMLATLLRAFPAGLMTCYAVGPAVGNVRNNSPACVVPLAARNGE